MGGVNVVLGPFWLILETEEAILEEFSFKIPVSSAFEYSFSPELIRKIVAVHSSAFEENLTEQNVQKSISKLQKTFSCSSKLGGKTIISIWFLFGHL